uniref:ARAD1C27544p n=1 Tax=Blastobotrys adeninivorans TaxID=409370 RepID=A0A060T2B4_BLAAD
MSGLSLEDLSFFDSRSQTTQRSHQSTSSINDLSSIFGQNANAAPKPTQPAASTTDQDDDFGDFVEFSEPPTPQLGTDSSKPLPQLGSDASKPQLGPAESKPAPQPGLAASKPAPQLGSDVSNPAGSESQSSLSTSLAPSQASLPSPVPPPRSSPPSIQSQISEMSSASTSNIKFGRHLVDVNGGKKVTYTSPSQWNNLLAATPGPRTSEESTRSVPKKNAKPVSNWSSAPAPVQKPNDLIGIDDEWGSFDDDNDPATANPTQNSGPTTAAYPESQVILEHLHSQSLVMIEQLFESLSPLSYSLRKRTLAHPRTKAFISSYLELVHVTARISAGRHRRTSDQNQSDIEARHTERVWQTIAKRLRTIYPGTIPELTAKLTFPKSGSHGKTCPLCGLSNTEFVKGFPKPVWHSNGSGHHSCITFWEHKQLFGM